MLNRAVYSPRKGNLVFFCLVRLFLFSCRWTDSSSARGNAGEVAGTGQDRTGVTGNREGARVVTTEQAGTRSGEERADHPLFRDTRAMLAPFSLHSLFPPSFAFSLPLFQRYVVAVQARLLHQKRARRSIFIPAVDFATNGCPNGFSRTHRPQPSRVTVGETPSGDKASFFPYPLATVPLLGTSTITTRTLHINAAPIMPPNSSTYLAIPHHSYSSFPLSTSLGCTASLLFLPTILTTHFYMAPLDRCFKSMRYPRRHGLHLPSCCATRNSAALARPLHAFVPLPTANLHMATAVSIPSADGTMPYTSLPPHSSPHS